MYTYPISYPRLRAVRPSPTLDLRSGALVRLAVDAVRPHEQFQHGLIHPLAQMVVNASSESFAASIGFCGVRCGRVRFGFVGIVSRGSFRFGGIYVAREEKMRP